MKSIESSFQFGAAADDQVLSQIMWKTHRYTVNVAVCRSCPLKNQLKSELTHHLERDFFLMLWVGDLEIHSYYHYGLHLVYDSKRYFASYLIFSFPVSAFATLI
jgi:hypothetical protein